MAFTFDFLMAFFKGLYYAAPVLLFLIFMIIMLGRIVGRKESWSGADTLYFSFITATTVGYGDFRPSTRAGKYIAIAIAFAGLLLTGIIVAIAVKAATLAFTDLYGATIL